MNIDKKVVIAVIVLLVLDILWIGLYMGKQYGPQVMAIQGSKLEMKPVYALLSYTLMVIGLIVFVMPRIRSGHELEDSLKYGLVFGIILYGVYDFTAAAVLKNWDMQLALKDIAWGGFVYFIASYIGSAVGKK